VRDASGFHVENVLLTIEAMSTSITAEATKLNTSWPFVTVPLFEVLGELTRKKSGLEIIMMAPLVRAEDAVRWEQYTVDNYYRWYAESQMVSITSNTGLVPSDYKSGSILPFIFAVDDSFGELEETVVYQARDSNPQGPYMPVWHMSPPPFNPQVINFDLFQLDSIFVQQASDVFRSRKAIFLPVARLDRLGNNAVKLEDHEAFHESLVDFVKDSTNSTYEHPHCVVLQPIFEQIHNDSSAIVGFLHGILPWDRYLIDLLPDGVRGITCVLKNTCNQAYTYELDGNSAFYRGEGDLHDPSYDGSEVIIPFYNTDEPDTENMPNTCRYYFYLYGTKELEESYQTSLPLVLSLSVAGAFIFMICTFFAYDYFVRQRNEKIVGAAARSGAIVSSLFPSNVRERLYAEQSEPSAKSQLKKFVDDSVALVAHDKSSEDDDDDGFMYKSKPIADLFPETTVLFADIVGFTAWSARREPTEVFVLLETLYKSFDAIAAKLGVYKVETIGDCYVAATGLPDPCKEHAVVMARFACDCMSQMHLVLPRLEGILGSDTMDLSMRFGLHSGPVTAGVLRGERSRFQLFGDTMNTASRIETTGEQGKIHVSQATADLLVLFGKWHWLTKRADKVTAKGKGEMQTYWLSRGQANIDGP
jgi:class 3 adenylate cyclase